MKEVVKAHVYGFEVKGPRLVGGGHKLEREVLFQRAHGQDVEPAQVEAGGGDLLFSGGSGIDSDFIDALATPERSHAQGDRPVGSILPDRGVTIVHELVAIVFKFLAKVVQHRKRFMAG